MKSIEVFKGLKLQEIVVEKNCEKHGLVSCKVFSFSGRVENDVLCPVCEEEREAQEKQMRLEKEKKRKQQVFEKLMKEYGVEPEFYYKGFDDYKPETKEQKQALEAVKKLVENKKGKVILIGSNGVGKTMLGCIAVKALGGKFIGMYELSAMIRSTYKKDSELDEFDIVEKLANVPMLVIDEIGRSKGSNSEQNWLSYILDKRHARGLPFMLLSNKHLMKNCKKNGCDECFENFVDNDVLSRLKQGTETITIIASDWRAKHTQL